MCTTDDDDIDFSSIKKNVLQVVHERRKQRVIQNISFSHKRREVHSPLPPGVGVCVLDFFFLFFFFFAERFQNHTLFWNHRKSYAFEKAYDFGTISLFSSLSTRRTTYSPIKLARKVGVCVLLLGIIIIKVLCVLHSLRGPTPVVVVLFFLVFFSSVLFLHFALFCAFYVYIRRRREDRFQSKIRHLARSQSHN